MKRIIFSFIIVLTITQIFGDNQSIPVPGFLENRGQITTTGGDLASDVQFVFPSQSIQIFLMKDGISYQFSQYSTDEDFAKNRATNRWSNEDQVMLNTHRFDMKLIGANPPTEIIKEEEGIASFRFYYRSEVSARVFQKVTYKTVYPFIDWVIYREGESIKYDFVVHPGGNPSDIRLSFTHHDGLKLDKYGNLTVKSSMGSIIEHAPVSFQSEKEVATVFELNENEIKFKVGDYRKDQVLVIDPSVNWATYFGGNGGEFLTYGTADMQGNLYLSGTTFSTMNIATPGAHQTNVSSLNNAFLAKFDPTGNLIWATYYGGNAGTNGSGCAVDTIGNVYLTGETRADSGISTSGAHQSNYAGTNGGFGDAYLVKFNALGQRLWGTYFGGVGEDAGSHCAIDPLSNSVYIVGLTNSDSAFVVGGHQPDFGGMWDGFLAKFSPSGNHQWSTYYGGSAFDIVNGVSVDHSGFVVISGTTNSPNNISTTGNHQYAPAGGISDAFLVRFNAAGNRVWGTYFGGFGEDVGHHCHTDSDDNIYLVGGTSSVFDIVTPNAHQNQKLSISHTAMNGYLTKFNALGVQQWGTYYGGSIEDEVIDVHAGLDGNIYISGYTRSPNQIPVINYNEIIATDGAHMSQFQGGSSDGFIAVFSTSGVRSWGSYFGGNNQDYGVACFTVDSSGHVYLAGQTASTQNIALGNTYQTTNPNGNMMAFLAEFDPCNTVNRMDVIHCEASFTSPSGNHVWTASNIFYDTLTNRFGCDSIIVVDLSLYELNTGITVENTFLRSNHSASPGVSYQWLDCDNQNIPIFGETQRVFAPGSNGNYAVIVSQSGCIDTSECVAFTKIGRDEFTQNQKVSLFPNPTQGDFFLVVNKSSDITISSGSGQVVFAKSALEAGEHRFSMRKFQTGIYFVRISNENGVVVKRVVYVGE
ncbi:MAG: SBBP repeat-containing protein [Cryomorphaceae bacterium]|nr:SBBP repeat-containing protein [Cryomorphaceae bacterium]